MSIVERPTKSMTEQAVDALASFEPMIEMLLSYADLTVADDGIGKVEEAHKSVKRLLFDLDKKRKERSVELSADCERDGQNTDGENRGG